MNMVLQCLCIKVKVTSNLGKKERKAMKDLNLKTSSKSILIIIYILHVLHESLSEN